MYGHIYLHIYIIHIFTYKHIYICTYINEKNKIDKLLEINLQ